MVSAATAAGAQTNSVAGKVVSEAGAPIANARVVDDASGKQTTTEQDGRFRLDLFPPGSRILRVIALDSNPRTRP